MENEVDETVELDDLKTVELDDLKAVSDIDEEMVLTTVDNPYNPKTEYYLWKLWDEENGYYTESYLARIADIPDDVDLGDDWIVNVLTNEAKHSILDNDVIGLYKLI